MKKKVEKVWRCKRRCKKYLELQEKVNGLTEALERANKEIQRLRDFQEYHKNEL